MNKRLRTTIFREFSKRAPNWLYLIVKSILWSLHPSKRSKFVWLLPHSSGYWLAVRKGRKLFVPSPKGDWQSFFVDEGHEQLVNDGDVVVEVGACVGRFALSVADKASKVIAIEPEPRNLACLRRNVNGCKNILVVGKAAWSRKGVMDLHRTSTASGHSLVPIESYRQIWKPLTGERIKVETDTIDNIVAELGVEKVDYMQLNIEGAELEALKGAREILKTVKAITAEAWTQETADKICRFLSKRGFSVHYKRGFVEARKHKY